MKIEDVALFERVAEAGSVKAGGKALGIAPTLASERLARLERSLGCTLAVRTTRSLSLTDKGRRFLPHARALLDAYREASDSVAESDARLTGDLRISAPSLFGRLFLPVPTMRFMRKNPDVRVSLSLSDRVADYAADGIDLAIRIGSPGDSSFRGRKIGENRRVLCAAPAYLDAVGRPKRPEDLPRHECLIFAGEDVWAFRGKDDTQSIRVAGHLESDSADMIKSATLLGLGVSLRSLWDVQDDIDAGRLERVLPDHEIVSEMSIWAIYPPGRFVSRATRAFSEELQIEFKSVLTD